MILRPPWRAILSVALLGLFVPADRAANAGAYFTTTVDELTVVSDVSAKRCSKIAVQFIRLDALMRDLAGWDADARLPPLKVFLIAARDEGIFLTAADRKKQDATRMNIYSKYMPGREYDIAAMLDEESYEEWMQSLFLMRAERLLIAGTTRRYPAWYQIGISNLLNGLLIREDGSIIFSRTTAFVPTTDETGGPRLKLDLPKLLAIARTGELKSQNDWQEFYARARDWAAFGILTTPERKQHFRDLALLMRQGMPADEAVKEAFGVTLEVLAADYGTNKWRKEVQYRMPPPAAAVIVPEPIRVADDGVDEQLKIVATRVLESADN
jgi:hypothetical protein